jgi:hypothetical protein
MFHFRNTAIQNLQQSYRRINTLLQRSNLSTSCTGACSFKSYMLYKSRSKLWQIVIVFYRYDQFSQQLIKSHGFTTTCYQCLLPLVINFVGLWVFDATGDQLCWTMSLWCHSWSTLLDYGSLIPLLTIYHFILKVSFIGRGWTRVPQNHWPSEVTDKLNHIML